MYLGFEKYFIQFSTLYLNKKNLFKVCLVAIAQNLKININDKSCWTIKKVNLRLYGKDQIQKMRLSLLSLIEGDLVIN